MHAPVLPSDKDFRDINHTNSKSLVMDGLDCTCDLYDVTPDRAFREVLRGSDQTSVLEDRGLRLDMSIVECERVGVVCVCHDES